MKTELVDRVRQYQGSQVQLEVLHIGETRSGGWVFKALKGIGMVGCMSILNTGESQMLLDLLLNNARCGLRNHVVCTVRRCRADNLMMIITHTLFI